MTGIKKIGLNPNTIELNKSSKCHKNCKLIAGLCAAALIVATSVATVAGGIFLFLSPLLIPVLVIKAAILALGIALTLGGVIASASIIAQLVQNAKTKRKLIAPPKDEINPKEVELKKVLEKTQVELAALKKEKEDNAQKVGEAKDKDLKQVQNLEQQINEMQKELILKNAELQGNQGLSEDRIKELQKEVESKKQDIEEAEKLIKGIEEKNQKIVDLENEINVLKKDYDIQINELNEVKQREREVKEKNIEKTDTLTQELKIAQNHIRKLKEEYKGKFDRVNLECTQYAAKNEELLIDNEKMKKMYQNQDQAHLELNQKIDGLQKDISKFKVQSFKSSQEIKKLNEQLNIKSERITVLNEKLLDETKLKEKLLNEKALDETLIKPIAFKEKKEEEKGNARLKFGVENPSTKYAYDDITFSPSKFITSQSMLHNFDPDSIKINFSPGNKKFKEEKS